MEDVQDLYPESYEETLLREMRQTETNGESYHVHVSGNSQYCLDAISPPI